MRSLLFSLLILAAISLCGQTTQYAGDWLGVNNIFFRHKDDLSEQPHPSIAQSLLRTELADYQFSGGFFWRKVNEDNSYWQIDFVAADWSTLREFTELIRLPMSTAEILGGQEVNALSFGSCYQRGKLWPIADKLLIDVGLEAAIFYDRMREEPLLSQFFPVQETEIGIGLNIEIGLVYQIFKRVNIAYHMRPVAASGYWYEYYLNNPILTEQQRRERSVEFGSAFLGSLFDLRNLHLSYVF
jgi:hypothetical protein